MLTVRPASDRGTAQFGWLDSRHSFSFGHYYDPQHLGFRSLRVINEDKIQPGGGFPTHGHRDMEIITYVIEGALAHKDSLGHGSTIRPGDVQRMSAGTGIFHSEFNASDRETVHLLQIWLLPNQQGVQPSYEQIHVGEAEKRGQLRLIASPDGGEGSVTIYQDASLYAGILDAGQSLQHELAPNRHAWIQVVRGALKTGDRLLTAGDGLAISDVSQVDLTADADESELLLFDLA